MDRRFNITWIGVQNTVGRDQNTIDRGCDAPWKGF